MGDVFIYTDYDDDHKFSEITVNDENVVGLSVDDIKKKFNEYLNLGLRIKRFSKL